MGRNELERAALTPNHEENAVYLSPGVEREGTRDEDKNRPGERELEAGPREAGQERGCGERWFSGQTSALFLRCHLH